MQLAPAALNAELGREAILLQLLRKGDRLFLKRTLAIYLPDFLRPLVIIR